MLLLSLGCLDPYNGSGRTVGREFIHPFIHYVLTESPQQGRGLAKESELPGAKWKEAPIPGGLRVQGTLTASASSPFAPRGFPCLGLVLALPLL